LEEEEKSRYDINALSGSDAPLEKKKQHLERVKELGWNVNETWLVTFP
jgi:hypothetical protein